MNTLLHQMLTFVVFFVFVSVFGHVSVFLNLSISFFLLDVFFVVVGANKMVGKLFCFYMFYMPRGPS